MTALELDIAKDRLIAAALRVAYAERGGLDHDNAPVELERANAILYGAAHRYVSAREADAVPVDGLDGAEASD